MRSFYKHLFPLFFSFLLFPLTGAATHIVGGSLTYVYNGGNSYTITLKLYKDCSSGAAAFDATAYIQVQQADSTSFSPTRDFVLSTISTSSVTPVLPPCATSPSVTPCVQERIYRATVTLAPSPGGMHLYYQVCCRNGSITNISTPSSVGESYYCYIPCYSYEWAENFTLANGTISDVAPTAWTRTVGATPPTSTQVNNNKFEFNGANSASYWLENFTLANGTTSDAGATAWTRTVSAGTVAQVTTNTYSVVGVASGSTTWTSGVIDISTAYGGVSLSAVLSESSTLEAGDNYVIQYSLNGGAPVTFPTNGSQANDFTSQTASTGTLTGNTIQIFCTITFDGTDAGEVYTLDNVTVTANASAKWISEVIDISSYTSGVNLSVSLSETSSLEATDNITVSYSLNGGAQVNFPTNGSLSDDFGMRFATATALVGTTIQIFVTAKYDAASSGEIYQIDMVSVYDNTFLTNNSPTFDVVPPLFFCQNVQDTIDYSATDPDGDSLVYSFYTPYEDASPCCFPYSPPTFDNNFPSFGTVTWLGGYSASSPFNSGGPALSIDTQTGEVSGVANSLGRYVFGVRCQEYRDGVFLGEVTRGYQVQTVVCPPFVPPPPTAGMSNSAPVCTGQTLSLTASTVTGATGYVWTGPNSFSSSLQNPTIASITTAATGTYSVYASVSGCNGSIGTYSVTIETTPATPSIASNSTVCSGQTLSLTSNTVGGSTYNWYGPNSFTSTAEDPTIASVTTAAAGTYTATRTSAAGCVSTATTTAVSITQTPSAPTGGSNTPICSGQTLSLTASTEGATYSWVGPNSFTSSLQNPTIASASTAASGNYTVTSTNSGCTGPAGTTSVTVKATPVTPTVGSNSPVCTGTTLSLTSNTIASATYAWTGPNSFTSTAEDPTISSVTTAAQGTYSVAASVSGCTGPAGTVTVTVNVTPSAPSASSNTPICNGQTLSLAASNIASATYSWSGPNSFTASVQNPTLAGATTAATGSYSVTATVSGCAGPAGVTSVTVNATPSTPVASSSSPVCSGQMLSLTASTVSGASYLWTGPNSFTSASQNPTISGVTTAYSGTYSVTATVAGCGSSAGTTSVTINQTPSAPTPSSNTPVCSGQTLNLTANTVAGATYSWTGPNSFTSSLEDPSIASITTAGSGSYSVTVTVLGCTGAAGITSATVHPTPAAPTAGSNSPICANATLNLTANTVAGATYSWTGPNSFTSTLEDPSIASASTAASGNYSVTVTVLGCTGPAGTTSVTVNPIPAAPTPNSNTPVCSGQTLNLTANTVAGATYSWTGPNSFTSTTEDPSIVPATTAASGNYSVTVTVLGCTGAAGTTSVTINQTPAATTPASNTPICANSTLNLASNTVAGATYAWTGPNSFTSTLEDPSIVSATTAASGNYSVTVTVLGCTGPAGTTSVTVNPIPSAPTPSSNTPVCSGQTLNLTANTVAGATYSWTGPNSFTSSLEDPSIASITTAGSGTYSVSVTVLGCGGSAGTTSVTINPTPVAPTAGNNSPICANATLNLTANTVAGATYSWTGPNSFTSTLEDPSIGSASTAASGNYSVTVTVLGCTGPAGTTSVTVNPIPGAPTPNSNTPVCSGQTLNLTANTVAGATYSWTGPNSFTSSLEDPSIASITTAGSGTYSVSVTVLGCGGSAGTTSVTVNQTPAAPTAGNNSPICTSTTLNLTANTVAGATYNWTGPNSFTSTLEDPSIGSATTAASGTYSVTVTVTGCTGPAGTTNATVSPPPAAPTIGNNSPICTGYILSLTANTTAGATYNWSGPNGFTSSLEDPTISSITLAAAGNYSLNVTVAGCTGALSTMSVTIDPGPSSPVPGSNAPICAGQDLNLTATATGISYNWSGPNSFTSTTQNPTITGATTAASGTYSVTATSANGCVSTPANTLSVTVNGIPAAPTAGNDSPLCTGQTVSLTASTIAGASYSWTGPSGFTSSLQNPTIPNLATSDEGTYSVTATVSGCTGAAGTTSVVVDNTPPTPVASSNAPCTGGTMSLTANNISMATYYWAGPASFTSTLQNPTIPGATTANAGSYSVTATVGGCTGAPGSTNVTVSINPAPPDPVVTVNSPVCAGQNLSLTSSTIAGAIYSWAGPNSFSSSLEDPVISSASTAASGTYSVVASYTTSCASNVITTSSATVTPLPIAPTAGSNSPLCTGVTLSLTASTVTGATYNWSGPNGFTSTAQNPTIGGVGTADAGTYSVTATASGCTGPAGTVSVAINPPQTPTTTSATTICAGQTLSLSANNVPGATYNWIGPNSFTSTLEDPTIVGVTVAASGTYSVDINLGGCIGPKGTTSVTVNAIPASPTPGSNSPICDGSNILLTSNTIGGSTYNWAGPNSFTSTLEDPVVVASTAAAGTYTLNIINIATGCASNTVTTSVSINLIPASPSITTTSPICSGQTLSLTASTVGGSTYSWTGPNNFTSTSQNPNIASITTAGSGTYSVSATENGCTSPVGTATVLVNQTPAAPTASSNTPVCDGQTLSLTASTVGASTYSWTGPNSFTSTLEDPTIAPISSLGAGIYLVVATENGCTGPAGVTSVTVTALPAAPAAGSNSPVCSGQTLLLTANTMVSATYSWTGPNSFTSTLEDPTIGSVTTAGNGTYSVSATVNGCAGPAGTTSVTVFQTPAAPSASSNSTVCSGQTLSLTASTVGSSTYNWTGPNSFANATQDPTIGSVTTAASGTYSVTATENGCTGPAGTTTVVINPTPAAPTAGNNSTICEGQTLSLTATTITGASYSWSGPAGFTSSLQNPTVPATTVANAGTYSVNATVGGCLGPDGTTLVVISATPVAPTAASNSSICSGQVLSLTASTVGSSTYAWTGPLGFTSASQNPTITAASTGRSGTYSVTATENGCTGPAGTTVVQVNPTPSITASSNTPVCEGNTISLTATTITGATYTWSGPAAFASGTQNPTISSASSTNTGTYTVFATSDAGCIGPNALHTATVTPSITVNAGTDQTICGNNSNISISGTVSGGTSTGIWSASGTGSYLPSASSLTTIYLPSGADTAAGVVTFTLTSTNNGGCTGVTDVLIATITDAPTANAGPDVTVCANNATVTLTGSVNSAASGGSWASSGTGTFSPDNLTLGAAYIPSAADTTAGSVILTLTTTGVGLCSPVADQMTVTITNAPTVNAGATIFVCSNNPNAALSGSSSTGNGTWTTAATGSFTPSATALTGTFVPSAADIALGSVDLILTTTSNGSCNPEDDTVTIVFTSPPVVNAGADQTVCANDNLLNVTGTSTTGTLIWTTSGTGTFTPTATALTATYTPTAADNTAGTVTITATSTNNGGCLAVNDPMIVTITPAPTANAGADQTVCSNNAVATMNGSFTVGTGGSWSTNNGTGSFSSATDMNATYTPSAADTASGSVNIILTTTGNGLCLAVTDTLILTISNAPLVNAGANVSVCINNPNALLSGTSSTGSGTWTTLGTGSFTPTAAALTTTYVPTAGDIAGGSVVLVLTSTSNGSCNAEDDTITIFFTPPPTVSAGSDVTVCANNATVTLSGTSSTGTGVWTSSGTGTFVPTATTLTASYIPSSADTAAGTVTLTLTTTNNGGCLAVNDQVVITITDAPIVSAGSDQTVCANNAVVSLTGSSNSVPTGILWSSSGTGSFGSTTNPITTYSPSPADTLAGTVTVTITSTGNGQCNAASDIMVISITDKPLVNAGINSVACKNNPNFPLSGFTSTGSGIWTTLGTGSFTPTATDLSATYVPSTADTTAGSVILILTSTNNGTCGVEDDSITITYIEKPIVNAGTDLTVCSNNAVATLAGASNTGSGQWSTLGTGTFTATLSLATTYTPSAADVGAGNVDLILTSTNNGTCLGVKDTVKLYFSTSPTASAGADQTVCANNAVVTLTGGFTVSSGAGWTSSGTGTFAPDTMTMGATYTPSAADTAAGNVTIYITTTGNGTCLSVMDSMLVTISDAPKVNAGANQLVCLSNPVATLNGTSTTGSGSWSTIGTGTFTSTTSLSSVYTASTADTTAGSVQLVLTSTSNGLCNPVTDTVLLTFVPTPVVNAGPDQTVCANADTVTLAGASTTGAGIWTTAGTGSFIPTANLLNALYGASLADTTAGTVALTLTSTGGCTAIADQMTVTITPAPVVNAGNNQILCSGTTTVAVTGTVGSGTTTGQWSSSGTGTFSPSATNLTSTYSITPADSAAGGVTLYLTSTNNGNCYPVTDSVIISIIQPPVVNAGSDVTVCALPSVFLNGIITGGSGTGQWATVGGGGTFTPNDSTLNALYHPASTDTGFGGTLSLVLTSTNNGSCPPSTDTVLITFIPPPAADAWNDITACKNNADSLQMNGNVTHAGGGQWSFVQGSGSFLPNDSTLNAYYMPDSAALTEDTLILVLTTTGNGSCTPVTDTMMIFLTPSPAVNAGTDIILCEGNVVAQLSSSVTGGATTGIWSTLGSGSFSPHDSLLNADYLLSTADTAGGGTTLILTSTNNGGCLAETDTVQITIETLPVVAAGPDTIVCANNGIINLNGSVTSLAGTGVWTTSGTGTFTPNDSTLNASYSPSAIDTAAGTVILTLTSTNGCQAVADSLTVTITNAPVANAGADITICEGSLVTLNGSVNSASDGGQWTSSGNGTFSPNDSTLNATYVTGSNDTSTVTITLTTTGNGLCSAVKDSMTITIGKNPVAAFVVSNICTGSPAIFTDSSSIIGLNDSIVSWNWTINNGNDTVQNPGYTYSVSGTDTVMLIVATALGCTDTVSHVVNINPTPVASFTVLTSCSLDSVYFTSLSTVGSGNIISWSWNFGDTTTSTLQNPVHYYDSSGVYIVSLTVTSDSGCTSTFTDTVIPAKSVTAGFSFNADCDFNVAFNDTSLTATGDSVVSWSWNFGDGSALNTSQNPSYTYSDTGTYIITLSIVTKGGCTDNVSDTVTLLPPPIADFSPQGGTYNAGASVTFTDLSVNATSWMWNFGDGNSDTVQNPSHTYDLNGTLNIMLIVTNSNGCPDTAEYVFIFNTNVVAVPSAFTPNNDGINDILYVRGGPLKEMEWRIYNEWGNEVFYSTDQNYGWDGTYKGKKQTEGRFVFILKGITYGDEAIELNGDVTILR